MRLIIDGYNLLNAAGIVAGVGLARSRLALLNFLAESLPPDEVPQTIVVFDAHDPPPGLPRRLEHRGLTVQFAARNQDADGLIEDLVRDSSTPRRLTVVSSDHRVQRAAHRRKAHFIDSDAWYAAVVRRRAQRRQATPQPPERPYVPLLADDIDYWIGQFGGESLLTALLSQEARDSGGGRPAPTTREEDELAESGSGKDAIVFDNPFPPGYAEDLQENDDPA